MCVGVGAQVLEDDFQRAMDSAETDDVTDERSRFRAVGGFEIRLLLGLVLPRLAHRLKPSAQLAAAIAGGCSHGGQGRNGARVGLRREARGADVLAKG